MSSSMDASCQGQGVAPVTSIGHTPVPIPIPISALTHSDLAEMIAKHGLDECIDIAAHWHSINSTPDPPTSEELLKRVKCVKPEHIDRYHQDLPNALALRLLAPHPGQSYGFEGVHTKKDGKHKYMYKCLNPGCNFLGKDKTRHMAGQHVRDTNSALCCPYKKCKHIFYKSRVSEFKKHWDDHEKKNDKLEDQGKAIIPLSFFQDKDWEEDNL